MKMLGELLKTLFKVLEDGAFKIVLFQYKKNWPLIFYQQQPYGSVFITIRFTRVLATGTTSTGFYGLYRFIIMLDWVRLILISPDYYLI